MRLQGRDWYWYRKSHKLTLVCIIRSDAGNYRADVIDEHRQHNHHWLNQTEAEALERSGYLDSHECYGESAFRDGSLTRLIREALRSMQKPFTNASLSNKYYNMRLKSFTVKQLVEYIGQDLFYLKGRQAYWIKTDEYISRDTLLKIANMKKCSDELEYAKAHYDELDAEDKAWIDEELEFENELGSL